MEGGCREAAALDEFVEYIESNNAGHDRPEDEKALFNFRDRLRHIIHGEVSDSTMF